MSQVVLIPLFAISLWMIALDNDHKFRHFYDNKKTADIARDVTGIRRFIALRNKELKFLGLGLLWAGFSIGSVLAGESYGTAPQATYALGVLGLLIYIISRLWPFLSK